jgi:MFS family permease
VTSADDNHVGTETAAYDEAVDGRALAHDALADVSLGGSSAFPLDVPIEPDGAGRQFKATTKIRADPAPTGRTPTPPAPSTTGPGPTVPAATAATESATPARHGWRRVAIDTRPLRHPAYRRMFVGSATSFFGTQLTAVAVPVQMYAMTKSNAWVGVLGVAGLIPLLIFSLWGGALADRLDRRRLLLVSSTVMWLVTLSLLAQAVLKINSPWLLLGLVAVQSAAVAVTMPTRSAIIPRIVPAAEMAQANTLNFTMSNVATVAGPLLAGVLIGTGGGVFWAYAADALTFTVALWAALRLPAMPPVGEVSEKRGGWSDVLFGLRYLGTTPVLLLSFAVDIAAMALALPRALFPAAADNEFHGGVGWLFSAIAIGAVVAGVSSGWVARVRHQGIALICAVVAWGIAVAAAGLAHQLWLAVILLAVGGAADLVSSVYRQTMLLTYAPDELRGRLQGVFTAVVAGGPRLGDLRAGLTASAVGTTTAWVGGGIAASIVAILIGLSFPALRRYTSTNR